MLSRLRRSTALCDSRRRRRFSESSWALQRNRSGLRSRYGVIYDSLLGSDILSHGDFGTQALRTRARDRHGEAGWCTMRPKCKAERSVVGVATMSRNIPCVLARNQHGTRCSWWWARRAHTRALACPRSRSGRRGGPSGARSGRTGAGPALRWGGRDGWCGLGEWRVGGRGRCQAWGVRSVGGRSSEEGVVVRSRVIKGRVRGRRRRRRGRKVVPMVCVVPARTKGTSCGGEDRVARRRVRELVGVERVRLGLVMVCRVVVRIGWSAIGSAAGIALRDLDRGWMSGAQAERGENYTPYWPGCRQSRR